MMIKKKMSLILMALSAVFFISGCKQNVGTPEDNAVVEETEDGEEEDDTGGHLYGFCVSDLSDPFYEVLRESVATAVDDEGSRMLVRDAQGDAELQTSQITELIDEGVEAVFLCPVDTSGITSALETLGEADIPVVNLDVRVTETDLAAAFVGCDEYNAGKLCGEDLIDRRPEGGSLVIVDCLESASANEGITGFEEEIADTGFEVTRIDTGSDYSVIRDQLNEILSDGAMIDAVMCADDRMAEQVLDTLDTADRNDIMVYSVGGSPTVKSALADQTSPMTGVGAKSPINMGKTAVKTAAAILEGDDYETETYIETFFIDKDNVDLYGTDGWQ